MQKLLHIADLHLGFEHRYLGDKGPRRAEEALQILERVVEWAVDDANEIAAVLIAGDLFETHDPDHQIAGRVITTLRRIPSSGRELITVPGNHDEYSYPESVYRLHESSWPGTLVTNPNPRQVTELQLNGVTCGIYAMTYIAGLSCSVLPPFEPAQEDVRIAVLHGTLDANPTDRSYRIDSQTLIRSGITYAALGHIHKPAEIRLGDGFAVYPGTLIGKGFDDPETPELVTIAFPGGRPVIERTPFTVRPVRTLPIDLGPFTTQDEVIAHLERELDEDAIVRLYPTGSRPPDLNLEHLRGRLASACFHLEIEDHSLEISADQIEQLMHQPTLKGLFVQQLMEREAEIAGDDAARHMIRLALAKGLTAFEAIERGH